MKNYGQQIKVLLALAFHVYIDCGEPVPDKSLKFRNRLV